MRSLLIAALLCIPATASAGDEMVPEDLTARGETAKLWDDYSIDKTPNPFYLRGDLDGDGKHDYVVGVTRKSDGVVRVVVLFGKKKAKPAWVDDADSPAHDYWYIVPKSHKLAAPKRKGEAIVMGKLESSSAAIYWNGKALKTVWLSD